MKTENLKTISEYAQMIGVTRQTIHNWINEGRLKTVRIGDRQFIKVKLAKIENQ